MPLIIFLLMRPQCQDCEVLFSCITSTNILTVSTLPGRNKHVHLPLLVISSGRGDRYIHAVVQTGALHSRQEEQYDLL